MDTKKIKRLQALEQVNVPANRLTVFWDSVKGYHYGNGEGGFVHVTPEEFEQLKNEYNVFLIRFMDMELEDDEQ